jgi:benzylsuccinate CoA-transferase BbsF subunit
MGSPDWAEVLTGDVMQRAANSLAIEALIAAWTAGQGRFDLMEEGQARGVPVAVPRSLDDVLAWPHLRERGAWRHVEVDGTTVEAPAVPLLEPPAWRAADDPWPAAAPAPARAANGRPRRWAPAVAGTRDAPLAGVRVVDLGWSWAGPYAGMLLAGLGADVVKVESTRQVDVLRFSGAFADGVRHHDRSGFFHAANAGKRSCTIDLKHPRGRELLLELVRRSHVVVENFTPRVLPSLGLGWSDLSAANPAVVLLSMCGYGSTGPDARYLAYGDHLLFASGLASVTGFDADPPTPIGTFYGDPVAGTYGALAVLAALAEAERTGRGRHLEYAQVEGLVSLIPTAVMRASAGTPVPRLGDRSAQTSPHGFHRCQGEDVWVAVACRDDRDWAALAGLLAADGVVVPDVPTVAGRLARDDEVAAAVSSWTATRSADQVVAACQAAGVPAHRLMDARDLVFDAHLAARRFFTVADHPVMGAGAICGLPFRVGEHGARQRGTAPLLGQHDTEVLVDVLGLSPGEVDDLVAAGVVA